MKRKILYQKENNLFSLQFRQSIYSKILSLNENYFLPVKGIFWLDVKPAARGGELARCLSAPTVKPFLFPTNGREA